MDLVETEKTIRRIDDDLVRLQYSFAIYESMRASDGRVKKNIVQRLSSKNSVVSLNHIDLIVQQDCALTICRMMDLGRDAHSFWGLKQQCHPNRGFLLENAKAQYLNPEDSDLSKKLADDMEGWIDSFVSKVSSLGKSREFKAIKNLRNDTLGHALKNRKELRPSMDMIQGCLPQLEDILRLSYLIFLLTDYRPQTAYHFALKDAVSFWSDFSRG